MCVCVCVCCEGGGRVELRTRKSNTLSPSMSKVRQMCLW